MRDLPEAHERIAEFATTSALLGLRAWLVCGVRVGTRWRDLPAAPVSLSPG